MEKEQIIERIKELIISVADFDLCKDEISCETDGIAKLGLNSLATIRLCAALEREYNVEIDLEDNAEILASVNSLVDYIIENQS